jgi:hypothetical protein
VDESPTVLLVTVIEGTLGVSAHCDWHKIELMNGFRSLGRSVGCVVKSYALLQATRQLELTTSLAHSTGQSRGLSHEDFTHVGQQTFVVSVKVPNVIRY